MNSEVKSKASRFKILCSIFIFLFPLIIFSQPAIQWQKSFGGSGNDFASFQQPTSDGGYIIVGYSNSSNGDLTANYGNYDIWALKISSLGSIQWQRSIGGTGVDAAHNIAETPDKGFIISGHSNSNDTSITGNHGKNDVLLVKLDSAGNVKWKKMYGGSENCCARSEETT